MSQQDYFIKFARELGILNGNIKSVLERLEKGDERMAKHEARLALLEQGLKSEADEPLKNWIIKALIRIIGWGTVIVGSLVGAGELLKSVHVG
mgnify:FL=1|jgi:hypothetical protein|nr:MAG TPA: hypothetical protein [Caudoviricetes sp.]